MKGSKATKGDKVARLPSLQAGTSYVVYIIFRFGNVGTQPTGVCFKDYFSGRTAMEAVYQAKEITETSTQWRHTSRPTIKLVALSTLFQAHLRENMVVVNVNSGAHFTHLGLVSCTFQSSAPLTPDIWFHACCKGFQHMSTSLTSSVLLCRKTSPWFWNSCTLTRREGSLRGRRSRYRTCCTRIPLPPMSCKLKLLRMTFQRQRTLLKRATRSTILTPLIPMNPNGKTVCTRPRQEGERRGMAKEVPKTRWLEIPVR